MFKWKRKNAINEFIKPDNYHYSLDIITSKPADYLNEMSIWIYNDLTVNNNCNVCTVDVLCRLREKINRKSQYIFSCTLRWIRTICILVERLDGQKAIATCRTMHICTLYHCSFNTFFTGNTKRKLHFYSKRRIAKQLCIFAAAFFFYLSAVERVLEYGTGNAFISACECPDAILNSYIFICSVVS